MKQKLKKLTSLEFYEDILVAILKPFVVFGMRLYRSPISAFRNLFLFSIQPFSKLYKSRKGKLALSIILVLIISTPVYYYFTSEKAASWWDDNWLYRKTISITNNTTQESDVYVSVTLDTSDPTRFQTDCGDLRFTDYSGNLLDYFIVSGCGTASTVIHTNFKVFPTGAQTIYYYFGNPSAPNGFSPTDFSTVASSYTIGTIGSEEIGPGPVGHWSFDEGYDTIAHDESGQGNDGTITGATWQEEEMCISGKCLFFGGAASVLIDDFDF